MITLPAELSAHSSIQSPSPTTTAPSKRLSGVVVVVADDNADAAVLLTNILAQLGATVHTAFDGAEAKELADRFNPDVLILDVEMPLANGYEVAQHVRGNTSLKRQPLLIALTGWAQATERMAAKAVGFNFHLVKPVDVDILSELIELGCKARS